MAGDYENSGKASRPSNLFASLGIVKKRNKVGVGPLAERYEKGLDIWSGEPLTGAARKQWAETMKREGITMEAEKPELYEVPDGTIDIDDSEDE